MKRIKTKFSVIIISFVLLFLSSCAGYLNVVPDNVVTMEDLFLNKESAYNALARCYYFLPYESGTHESTWGLGDDFIGRIDLQGLGDLRPQRIMQGWQTVSDPRIGFWSGNNCRHQYRGINQCETFLKYIDLVRDMTEGEIKEWKAQVKFLKAYFMWWLVKHYGPIVIPDEGVIDPEASSVGLFKRRSTVEECFDYILKLMDEAIPDLTDRATTLNAGQIDKMVAKSVKARILFFRASPFFNGNKEYYGDFFNHEGKPFFPLEYNPNKWKEAVDALDEAIKFCEANGKGMYTYEKEPFVFDYEAFEKNRANMKILYDNRMVVCDAWNKELVWGFTNFNFYDQGDFMQSTNMRLPDGYGDGVKNEAYQSWQWMAATYQAMMRYYTNNGVPIDEDFTFDKSKMFDIVTTPGQAEPAYQPLWGIMQPGHETIQLNLNREPRFYANIAITGGYWRTHSVLIKTVMYQGRDGGFNSATHTFDFYCTGIALKKFVHPENMSGAWQRTIKYPYPLVRMSDLYLMKAEALNEFNSAPTQEVYDLVNKIRRRAGIPDVEKVWADPNIVRSVNRHKTKEGMRDIILEERGIELAFEGSRFWDMHRHKRAVREFSSPILGWTHTGTSAGTFFVLEAKQARRFTIRDCLWPIDLNEMNTNGNLIQNPGW